MNKQVLTQIMDMVKQSEILDQQGHIEESFNMMYNAFELTEDETYKLADELNDMTKTASVEKTSKIEDFENMQKLAAGIGSWLTEKAKPWLGEAWQGAKKGIGEFLGGAKDDIGKPGLLDKFWNKGKAKIPGRNAIPALGNMPGRAAIPGQEATKGSLTNLGKMGVGALGLGAAGVAGSALGKDKPNPIETGRAPFSGSPIPSATGSGATNLSGGQSILMSGGPSMNSGATAQISAIEQRISNLEQLVQAIRTKVGM